MLGRHRRPIRLAKLILSALSMAFSVSGCALGPVCDGAPPTAVTVDGNADAIALVTTVDQHATALLKHRSIANLDCWADQGDRMAQYALGRAYERGEAGLPADSASAIRYYRKAAKTISNQTYVYSPPVGKESYGRVIPVTAGPPSPGLPEAIEALKRLENTRE